MPEESFQDKTEPATPRKKEEARKKVIDSTNPNIEGWDGAIMSYVRYLYELGK